MAKNNHITVVEANEMINKLISSSSKEASVFISLLSEKYIEKYKIPKEKFIKMLSENLDKLDNN
ncbi:MAG: hypothetical protein IKF38_01145 [Clostridia bacterium]|nr:hypothetical protein [Clostridia bacterium]